MFCDTDIGEKGKCSRILECLEKQSDSEFFIWRVEKLFHDFQILLCFLLQLLYRKKDESDEYVRCIVFLMMYIRRKNSRFMYSATMNGKNIKRILQCYNNVITRVKLAEIL
jgi:hypothetical protein